MWQDIELKVVSSNVKSVCLQQLCKICNSMWGSRMLLEGENVLGILRTERSTMRAMCGVQLRDRKRVNDLM